MDAEELENMLGSVKDIQKLTPKQLNLLLKKHGKSTKGKKAHKISVLCSILGLETGDSACGESSIRTVMNNVREIKTGWTKNIRLCPTVTMDMLTTYLLNVHDTVTHTERGDIEFTKENMTRYKTLRSWRLYDAGHVHSMAFLPMDDSQFCSVKAKCNPSFDTSGTVYEQVIMFSKSSESVGPVCSSCTCAAGQGEGCTHVAAVLFAMEDFSSRGHHTLPDDPSSTEILCAWNAPKGTKVEAVPLKQVPFTKGTPGQSKSKRKRLADFEPLPPHMRGVLPEEYHRLINDLNQCQPDVPFLTIADPKRYPLCQDNKDAVVPVETLPDYVQPHDSCLIPAYEMTVETSPPDPPCVRYMVKNNSNFVLTTEERDRIETLTNGQSSNKKWFKYREGVITGSVIHQVNSRMKSITSGKASDADRLVKLCLGRDTFKGNKATLYGSANEAKAAKEYECLVSKKHHNFKVKACGLNLMTHKCYLGGSPDRIASCDCHGPRVVEIKCPSSLANKPSSIHTLPCIKAEGENYVVNKSHPYYSQVVWYMGITGHITNEADLFVWTPHENIILHVNHDEVKWQELHGNADLFFKSYVLPQLQSSQESHSSAVDVRATVVKENLCGTCNALLLGGESLVSEADNSVQCECACGCNSWHHWKCTSTPNRTAEQWNNTENWKCHACTSC